MLPYSLSVRSTLVANDEARCKHAPVLRHFRRRNPATKCARTSFDGAGTIGRLFCFVARLSNLFELGQRAHAISKGVLAVRGMEPNCRPLSRADGEGADSARGPGVGGKREEEGSGSGFKIGKRRARQAGYACQPGASLRLSGHHGRRCSQGDDGPARQAQLSGCVQTARVA